MQVLEFSKIVKSGKKESLFTKSAITVGSFDGPHLGHIALFNKVFCAARRYNCPSLIVTFNTPLPAIKHKGSYMGNLSTLAIRLNHYEKAGFTYCILIDFNLDFSRIESIEFLKILKERLGMIYIAEGEDFHFGYKGAGDIKTIRQFCRENSIEFEGIEAVNGEEGRISSSAIRQYIKAGNFIKAGRLLGYDYEIDVKKAECKRREEEGRVIYYYKKSDILQVLPMDSGYNALITGAINTDNAYILRTYLELKGEYLNLVPFNNNEVSCIYKIKILNKEH